MFGVRVLVARQSPWEHDSATTEPGASAEIRGSWQQLHELAAQADIVALTCTETPATRGMINDQFLSACKPGVIIVNVARGNPPSLLLLVCMDIMIVQFPNLQHENGIHLSIDLVIIIAPRIGT